MDNFPTEPIDHIGRCKHGAGFVGLYGFNCTICGYFIPKTKNPIFFETENKIHKSDKNGPNKQTTGMTWD